MLHVAKNDEVSIAAKQKTVSNDLQEVGAHLKQLHLLPHENQQELHRFPMCKIQYRRCNFGSNAIILHEFQ